jgi:prevent-host-death family protein
MLATGITALKTDLRKYLARVKKGEVVVVTDHGTPIARLVPAESRRDSVERQLRTLAQTGAVVLPCRALSRTTRKPPALKGKPLSEIVIEDRR